DGGLSGAAADQGCVQVAWSEERVGAAAEPQVEVIEGDQVVAGGRDGVGAEWWGAAVGGDSGDGEFGPDESSVGGSDLPLGGFGHYGAVDADLAEVRGAFGDAEAGWLLVV